MYLVLLTSRFYLWPKTVSLPCVSVVWNINSENLEHLQKTQKTFRHSFCSDVAVLVTLFWFSCLWCCLALTDCDEAMQYRWLLPRCSFHALTEEYQHVCFIWPHTSKISTFKETIPLHVPVINIIIYFTLPSPSDNDNVKSHNTRSICAIIHTNALWVFCYLLLLYYMSVLYNILSFYY